MICRSDCDMIMVVIAIANMSANENENEFESGWKESSVVCVMMTSHYVVGVTMIRLMFDLYRNRCFASSDSVDLSKLGESTTSQYGNMKVNLPVSESTLQKVAMPRQVFL